MQTILTLGNALNQETARGSAIGFKLDSLLKLPDTRAINNKMTLMHYLCKELMSGYKREKLLNVCLHSSIISEVVNHARADFCSQLIAHERKILWFQGVRLRGSICF